ncbi:HAMP domain-containing protein [Flavobacteriaceae bacterium XHP0103]|uniref:ATP-binding protein n=1 Tax=Marixanthotalea marina TaxID=2844359 RepID=UPI002989E8D8|nr:ATP-binding protein [Marixanthotalea marina]MBU3821101.1 HAMP domain-containing protein [Marixanthotalea marina]
MKIRHSIVTRFALFFTGLIIFSIILSGYLVFKNASKVIVDYSKERISYTSELAEQSFYALLGEVSNDIAVIANSPTLQDYINNTSAKTAQDLEHYFEVTLENKSSYFQIRLIGIENNGKEIVRLDKINDNVLLSTELQEKGDKEYFTEAIKMSKGEFYFSQINLNEEHGVISEPYTPTLRAASPVYDANNKKLGIVIINVDLTQFFEALKRISGSELRFYLIDAYGQYLFANNKDMEFGLQTKSERNFFNDFNLDRASVFSDAFKELNNNINTDLLSYFKEVTYFKGARKLYLISTVRDSILMRSAKLVRKDSFKILLFVCLFSIIVSWFFVNYFSKKINQVTEAISNYDTGVESDIKLPTNRKDEIGVLATTFNKMKAKIDEQVNELHESLEKEKQAKMQRDEFLQNMSHEMRTPLNTILGLTKLLSKNTPTDAQRPIINSLERSANSLAGLVYDVLDHKKLVEGKLQIEYEPTNIAELLKDIHSTYQYDAVQKGLAFSLKIDKKLEAQAYQTDALRLSQIVINLVVNAIKYTQKGSVNLNAKIINKGESVLEITVVDTGIGIFPENLGKINDRFFREKEDLSGRYGGYGLGLSIVKQLTALFGGTLVATSEKGVGSEFCVSLPVIPIEKGKKELTKNALKQPKLSNTYTVLHIEDDATTMDLMKHVLEDTHISLVQLNKLDRVSEYLEVNAPNIIISDLMLGNENIQAILNVWVKDGKIKCPLVVASALEPETMAKITPLYFQKPFDIDNLRDIVFRVLGSEEFVEPNFSSLYKNYDNDASKITKVLKLLETEFETYIKRIENVVKNKDQEDWEAILHKLIAHINNLKLGSLESLPKDIKHLGKDDLNRIKNIFVYYLCCFRVEEYLNSKG